VAWSARDETLHTLSIIRLHKTFLAENPEVDTEELKRDLYKICETIITHEDAFIDLAFGVGGIEGLEAEDVKRYIRFIGDRRLMQLGLEPMYRIERNPLPWMDEILNGVEHTNFFENRVTEYTKAATTGSWEDAFDAQTFGEEEEAA
jgi:ribonucleoside-diphosphate reductase beta chain